MGESGVENEQLAVVAGTKHDHRGDHDPIRDPCVLAVSQSACRTACVVVGGRVQIPHAADRFVAVDGRTTAGWDGEFAHIGEG